ncbi:hypothetical protein [Sphaerisporangium corydalis]|uniref:Secreted protein n=1 Tax=Sphaerisporangium corydalis TaxID=1441875 RepID=A0ABV9EEH0_9ACTN|nr:hypothetical protein [Sphaerisporangium corydalis]
MNPHLEVFVRKVITHTLVGLFLASTGIAVTAEAAQAAGPCTRASYTNWSARWTCGSSGGGEFRATIRCLDNNGYPYTYYDRYGAWRPAGDAYGSVARCDFSNDQRMSDGAQTR